MDSPVLQCLSTPIACAFLFLLVLFSVSVTVVTMEIAQERGLSAGTSETRAAHGVAVEAVRRRKRASMYGAQIWDPSRRNNVWLGTFATAMDAAKAYDAAAVELHGAAAQTNFKIPAAGRSRASVAAGSAQEQGLGAGECEVAEERKNRVEAVEKRKGKALPDRARTEFRGVWWQPSGEYLGTFVAAEDAAAVKLPCVKKATCRPYNRTGFRGVPKEAARAYNTAAIKPHGGAAKTNFKSPAAGDINPEHVQMICLKQTPVEAPAKVNTNVQVRRRAVVRSDCRSGFRGVGLYNGRYIAQIREPRRPTTRHQLGIFHNVEDAARAYDAAALRLYGAAARTNFEQPPTGATADDLPELPLRSSTISASPACCRVPQGDGLH